MKKIFNCITLVVLLLLLTPITSWSQSPEDVVLMKNGEKKIGKVNSVNTNSIKFTYSKETAEYEISKSEINKITFSSGRTESFDNQQQNNQTNNALSDSPISSTSSERKNKIAILPFEINTNDQNLANPSMSKQVQESCISALKSQAPYQVIQDPIITNNILAKKNLTAKDHDAYTPKEWAEILGVEYVIIGTYSIQNKGTSTYGGGFSTYDDKTKHGGNTDKTKGTSYGANNSNTTVNYDTHVSVSIYNDNGQQLFTDTRSPMLGGIDSYKSALKTIMKKSPFGKK